MESNHPLYKKIFIPKGKHNTYLVTDLHGYYEQFNKILHEIGYNEPDHNGVRDIMISCGDLIDRGSGSYDLAQTFRFSPDKHTILGNHEELAINGINLRSGHYQLWQANGGNWAEKYNTYVLKDLVDWFDTLPICIEIEFEDGPSVGITHAAIPKGYSWSEFVRFIKDARDKDSIARVLNYILWNRSLLTSNDNFVVDGVDYVVHGHNVVSERPLSLGNRVYMDNGVYLSKYDSSYFFTVLKFNKSKRGSVAGGWFDILQFTEYNSNKLKWV